MNVAILIILTIVSIIDLWLVLTKRPTISQWVQAQLPTFLDLIILVGIMVILFESIKIDFRLRIALGILAGHVFFPNKERYR